MNICGYYDHFVHISIFHVFVHAYFLLEAEFKFKCTCCNWAVSHLSIRIFLFSLAMTSSFLKAVGLSIPAHTVAALLSRVVAMASVKKFAS